MKVLDEKAEQSIKRSGDIVLSILSDKKPRTLKEIEREFESRWIAQGKKYDTDVVRKCNSGLYENKKKGKVIVIAKNQMNHDLYSVPDIMPSKFQEMNNKIKRAKECVNSAIRTLRKYEDLKDKHLIKKLFDKGKSRPTGRVI